MPFDLIYKICIFLYILLIAHSLTQFLQKTLNNYVNYIVFVKKSYAIFCVIWQQFLKMYNNF